MQLCDADRFRMYIRIQHVPVPLITDTDEMSARPNQFFARLGWAERGRDAIYNCHRSPQLQCAGHIHSLGWLCWKVLVDETINSAKFIDYMENTLQPLLVPGRLPLQLAGREEVRQTSLRRERIFGVCSHLLHLAVRSFRAIEEESDPCGALGRHLY